MVALPLSEKALTDCGAISPGSSHLATGLKRLVERGILVSTPAGFMAANPKDPA